MNATRKLLVVIFAGLLASFCLVAGCAKDEPPVFTHSDLLDETLKRAQDEVEAERARQAHEAELQEPFYVLIMGTDGRDNTSEGESVEEGQVKDVGRSDTMMLARVWPETGAITLVSIPRDTHTVYNGVDMRLNSVYNKAGAEAAAEHIGQLAGITVDYYFKTEFARFVPLIDAIGGVDVTSPVYMWQKDAISGIWYEVPEGDSHLDGKEALIFARVRKVFGDDQDACRQIQDRQIVQRVLEGVPGKDMADLQLMVDAIYTYTDTNLPKEDFEFYAKQFGSLESISFQSGTFPYSGFLNEDLDMWLIPFDEAIWKEVIAKVEEGGNPTDVVALPEIWFN